MKFVEKNTALFNKAIQSKDANSRLFAGVVNSELICLDTLDID